MNNKNTITEQLRILRRPEVLKRIGLSKSQLYILVNEKLMPPPISLGERSVGFYKHEVQAVIAAMGAGYSKEKIKALINLLVEQRQELAKVAYHE